jgi:hypothetical protein
MFIGTSGGLSEAALCRERSPATHVPSNEIDAQRYAISA